MYQGVVHISLRLRSRIYNNSLGERLLFRTWNFPRSKQASSQQRHLWMLRVVSNFGDGDCGEDKIHTRARNFEARVCISPVGAKLVSVHPSIHYRENLDFTPAGIRVAFSYRRMQLSNILYIIFIYNFH